MAIETMAGLLLRVPGVTGVLLGGSRARGDHRPDSDTDLGVYYRGPLDLARLESLAADIVGGPVDIAGPGEWGPWVNGGAWLVRDGVHVDWILRDLDRVRRVWHDCAEGRYEIGYQPGHPLGFWSPCYAGEVALGRLLADPSGELGDLRRQASTYPEPLRSALAAAAWEADFSTQPQREGRARRRRRYACGARGFHPPGTGAARPPRHHRRGTHRERRVGGRAGDRGARGPHRLGTLGRYRRQAHVLGASRWCQYRMSELAVPARHPVPPTGQKRLATDSDIPSRKSDIPGGFAASVRRAR